MNTYDIIKIVFGVVASISGAGGVIWYFVKLTSNTLADQYIEKVKYGFEKELESYKTQLDVLKATTLRYNDKQFELYLDLWKNLQELKFASMDLWNEASRKNLSHFRTALSKSERQIETSSILIELSHYSELREIIKTLKEYDFGKQRLIDNRPNVSNEMIENMIDFNRERKDRCLELIETIKSEIQIQIKGES